MMIFLTKFLPLFLLTNGSFILSSSSSSSSSSDLPSTTSKYDTIDLSNATKSPIQSPVDSTGTGQRFSGLSVSSSDRFVTIRKKKQDPDFSVKGGNKGGHRLTTSSTTTVTTVSPLAITTVSPQSDSSLTSTADLSTAATTVSSASSTSMSLAAVFETEMQPPSKTNSGNDVLITNGNLGREGLSFRLPSGSASSSSEGRSHVAGKSESTGRSATDDREVCDFCIYQGEGNFTSYGYPLNYKPNLNCTYRIQRNNDIMADVCELELIFHDFDIPVSSIGAARPASFDCKEDYLEVQGRRFCGSGWRDKMEVISFPLEQRELIFHFISNERVNGRGFWLEVRRRADSCFDRSTVKMCEERYNEEDFIISSPKFPLNYPNNADCTYTITKSSPQVCALELTFMKFDIESVNGCYYDYLEIEGQKICGSYLTNTKRTIDFRGEQKSLIFHTDKQVTRGGFNIKVTQVTDCHSNVLLPPPPSCNICTKETSGTLVSYNYPDPYRNNLLCTYTIEKTSRDMCSVELYFDDFDVLPSVDCMKDYLQISGQRYCGTTLHSTKKVVSFDTEDSLTLVFRTNDALSSKGFSLKYTQKSCTTGSSMETAADKVATNDRPHQLLFRPNQLNLPSMNFDVNTLTNHLRIPNDSSNDANNLLGKKCDYIYSERSFFLKSENYSQGNYPVDIDCNYYVTKNTSRVCYLELSFIRFDVEASAQCQFDYLEINNVRLCGSLAKETTRTYIFEGHEKMIRFHSDSSNTRSGFFIRVDQLECDGDVIIRSPPPAELTTTNLDSLSSSSTVSPPHRLTNRDGELSTSSLKNQPKSCNQFFMSQQFEIRSPSYPRSYPPSIECIYYIKKSSTQVCRIEVTYHEFRLKSSDNNGICKYDYLDFNGIRMCGTMNKGDTRLYYFPDTEFKLRFYTNDQINQDGKFRISLKQIDCQVNSLSSSQLDSMLRINNDNKQLGHKVQSQQQSHHLPTGLHQQQQQLSSSTRDLSQVHSCDQTFDLVAFEIKSPSYPNNYPTGMNCRYTINKVTPAATGDPICQLEVNFIQHNTPTSDLIRKSSSSQCTNDYLTFENYGRMCGKVPSDTVKFFPFDGSTFTIDFHSDRQKENDLIFHGFHLQVRQRECLTLKSPALKQDSNLYDSSSLLSSNSPYASDSASQSVATVDSKRDHLSLSSTQCGQMVSDLEFEIKSPYYPSSYSENVECVFTIRKNHHAICNIELRFIEFDVEESPHCTKDYLLMDGKKFCGRYKPNTYMNFDFTSSNEKIIYFKSDLESSRRGFLLTGKQKPCETSTVSTNFIGLPGATGDSLSSSLFPRNPSIQSYPSSNSFYSVSPASQSAPSICEYCFSNASGMITSYGYPRKYPANVDCNYKISALPGYCSLEINVEIFNLPSDGECNEDYLQIDQNRYCSNQLQGATKMIPFRGTPGEVRIHFSSNSYNEGKGFKMNYNQVACDSLANRNGVGEGVSSTSSHVPSASSVSAGSSSNSLSTVDSSSSSSSSSSGSSSSASTTIASGSQISVIDATPIDHIAPTLYGSTSSAVIPGVPGANRVPCDLVVYDLYFEISSPGYPYGYPANADCLYSVRRLNNRICSLVLHFIELDLSPSSSCIADYLEVDGQRICSGIANDTKKEIEFNSYKIPLRFKTDTIGTRNKGFFIKGIQKECGYTGYSAASSSSHLQVHADASQNRNSYYPSSLTTGRFQAPYEATSSNSNSPIVTISGRVQIPPLRVKETDFPPAHSSSSLYPPAVSSSSSDLYASSPSIASSSLDSLRHHRNRYSPSSSSLSPPTQFSTLGSSPSCDITINETFFELKSPNYPSRYPSGSKCTYTIEKATKNVCNLDLQFNSFDIGDATCLGDHLSIDGDKFCGIIPRERIQSFRFNGNIKLISFIGSQGFGNGFILRGRQVECAEYTRSSSYLRSIASDSLPPANLDSTLDKLKTSPISERIPVIPFCDQTFTTNSFIIRSPNYPKEYPASLYCRYTIRRPSEAVCGLEFKFKSFDLEDSTKCSKDFLEIDTGKLCGHLPANHERRYYYFSGENEKVLTFRTDSSTSNSGFKIEVSQVTNCNPHIESTVISPTESLCDHTSNDIRGHISSLNFPNQYPDYVKCTYRIKAANSHYCQVRLALRDIDIQASPACDKDYLYIKGERVCGHDLAPREIILPIPDHGPFREVTFNFVSDASISRRGFYIEFTQELCSTSLKEGISYSVVNSPVSPSSSSSSSSFQSSSSSSSAIHPPISVISLNSPSNKGSPEYPSNYVARAQLEQIVEAQVTVLDSKDGLSVPAIQVSSVVSNDAISSNHSYPSLG